jgi:hypothetical protein
MREIKKSQPLSEALHLSIANRGLYGAESKDPGDACWQMLLGAFRPQTTTEYKKSQTPGEADLSRLAVEGSAVPRTFPGNVFRQRVVESSRNSYAHIRQPRCSTVWHKRKSLSSRITTIGREFQHDLPLRIRVPTGVGPLAIVQNKDLGGTAGTDRALSLHFGFYDVFAV